jgi:hypothetical protein
MAELNSKAEARASVPATPAPEPVALAPAPTPAAVTPAPVAPAPVVPQPVPASVKTGLDRLAELTDLYKSNQITPAQYHQERAKIVESLKK